MGPDPIVLVPYQTLWGSNLGGQRGYLRGGLADFDVSHVDNMPSGGGVGYMGTIGGVHVYSANVMRNEAVLCSRHLLLGISYGVVHGQTDIVDLYFVDDDDPEKSRVRLKFAQDIRWAEFIFVEFK